MGAKGVSLTVAPIQFDILLYCVVVDTGSSSSSIDCATLYCRVSSLYSVYTHTNKYVPCSCGAAYIPPRKKNGSFIKRGVKKITI